jgi:hypothetical protein
MGVELFKLQGAYCLKILKKKHCLYKILIDSCWTPSEVYQEYQDFIRTPDGVHQDPWGSVTYRILYFNLAKM